MTIAYAAAVASCPYCGSTELRVELKNRFLVCRSCGSVVDDMPIDYGTPRSLVEPPAGGRRGEKNAEKPRTMLSLVEKIGVTSSLVDGDYAELLATNQHALRELLANACVRERLARIRSKDLLRPLLALLIAHVRGLGDTVPSLYAQGLDRRRRSMLSRKAREIVSDCLSLG